MREAKQQLDKRVKSADSLRDQYVQAQKQAVLALQDYELCQAKYHGAVTLLAAGVPQARPEPQGPVRHGLHLSKLLDGEGFEVFEDDGLFGLEAEGIEISSSEREEVEKRKAEVEQ
eukprot:535010-Pyramimonas_sp.AAC.1